MRSSWVGEASAACLNCGAALHGPFCSACGQRAIPPYPSLRELAGDAWNEFSGYDGRFVRTFRALLRPGVLTIDVLEGRRARYVSPLRVYLASSVIYFLVAAAVPDSSPGRATVQLDDRSFELSATMPAGEREELLRRLERAPWWAQMLIRPSLDDFESVQARFRDRFPRALFALVPLFAAIVALFYRRRRFTQHLIFALHLHAAVFLLLSLAALSRGSRSGGVTTVVGLSVTALAGVYVWRAFRRVYGGRWWAIAAKSAAIGIIYIVVISLAVLATYAWAVLT